MLSGPTSVNTTRGKSPKRNSPFFPRVLFFRTRFFSHRVRGICRRGSANMACKGRRGSRAARLVVLVLVLRQGQGVREQRGPSGGSGGQTRGRAGGCRKTRHRQKGHGTDTADAQVLVLGVIGIGVSPVPQSLPMFQYGACSSAASGASRLLVRLLLPRAIPLAAPPLWCRDVASLAALVFLSARVGFPGVPQVPPGGRAWVRPTPGGVILGKRRGGEASEHLSAQSDRSYMLA